MGELASAGQLRASYLRWAIVAVPVVLLLGLASGLLSGSGPANPWFAELRQPPGAPPAWAFPVIWSTLYALMGLALAAVLNARRARWRGIALVLFAAQLALNLAWSPTFFALHAVWGALAVIALLLAAALGATVAMARVRRSAGWLMVPYCAWLCVATALNAQIALLNPHAADLAPGGASVQIQG